MDPETGTLRITLRVNGQEHSLVVGSQQTLLEVLREELEVDSVREACSIGMCGACTVLVEGRVISSCLTLAAQADGRSIVTVEGLSESGQLHPVQQAFLDYAAFQCAYCTPGFVLTTVALLADEPHPDAPTIREYLDGNLCRCGSYVNILQAVQAAARQSGPAS